MEYLKLDRQDNRVCLMTMNYKSENRFNPDFMKEIMDSLDELEKDDGVGAIVLTGGDPKFWSNGLDLEWLMQNFQDKDVLIGYMQQVNELFARWCLYPKPTVAALNGHTFAAGLFLAGYLDFRFMREDRGWICLPEVNINIPLLPAMIAICRATMNESGFRKLYYTGEKFTGRQAVEFGFVEKVMPLEELVPACVEFAGKLAEKKTRTYAEMKKRLRGEISRILLEEDPEYFKKALEFSMPGS